MPHLDDDRLVLVALEATAPSDDERAHLDGCAACTDDVTAMSAVVRLGRESLRVEDFPPPPPKVWRSIASATVNRVGGTAGKARHAPPVPRHSTRVEPAAQRRRRVAALLVAAVLGGATTLGIVRFQGAPALLASAGATLTPQAPAARSARGTAVLVVEDGGRHVRIHVAGLPKPAGFYQVWLYDPDTGAMVAIGALGTSDDVDLPVPPAVDPAAYRIVDVSAQPLTGDPTHGPSMLRGTLATYSQPHPLPNGIEGRKG